MTASWDAMRKEARRLETDIDAKLVEYSKLAASLQSSTTRVSFDATRPSNEDEAVQRRAPQRDGATADAMTMEMESLLARLRGVVDAMTELVGAGGGAGGGAALQHTRQRHAEILHDYTQEFRKTRDVVSASRETSELMAGAGMEAVGVGGGGGGAVDALYKERAAIGGAMGGADAAIGTGLSLKEDLERQRAMFASMVGRMETMSEGLPAVNRLIGQIRRKKKRDVLVMAAVVSVLLFSTFSWKVLH